MKGTNRTKGFQIPKCQVYLLLVWLAMMFLHPKHERLGFLFFFTFLCFVFYFKRIVDPHALYCSPILFFINKINNILRIFQCFKLISLIQELMY